MYRRLFQMTLALGTSLLASQFLCAQTPRQEARQERREQRQAQPPAAQQRQQAAQQLNNRSAYFSDGTWSTLDPWISRNKVQPLPRTAPAGAAANAAGRAAEAGANAVGRAARAAERATERAADAAANTANRAANRAAAAGNAAGATVAGAAAANARFGFNNPNVANTKDTWFYDYYSFSPTVYSAGSGDAKAYGSAARYYDYNSDGIYDNLSTFRDSDNDGRFDAYDRLDFADVQNEKTDVAISDGPSDASRHTVTGAVEAMKVAKVNGSENLVAKLASDRRDGVTVVDLGAAERWKSDAIREGDQITATGPVEQVGEKQIILAETVSVGKQKEVQIARSGPRLQGMIVDVTNAEVKGAQHTMAIIESESSRQIVDLGPTNSLKVKVQPQTKISVQGVPVQFRDYSVVLADRIELDGQDIVIQRQ